MANSVSGVKTAERTLDLFELFAKEQRPLNLSEISALMGMPISSAHGLVKTLQARGYLLEVGRRAGYFPSGRLHAIGASISRAMPLLSILEPILSALRDATGETVALAKRQGDRVVYMSVFESHQTVRFSSMAGDVKPLHTTASGKALLGALPPDALEEQLARLLLVKRTEATLTSPRELREQIEEGRRRGWFHTFSENTAGLMAAAIPVVIGGETHAVLVGGPNDRFKPLLARHAAALLRARDEILHRIADGDAASKTPPPLRQAALATPPEPGSSESTLSKRKACSRSASASGIDKKANETR